MKKKAQNKTNETYTASITHYTTINPNILSNLYYIHQKCQMQRSQKKNKTKQQKQNKQKGNFNFMTT